MDDSWEEFLNKESDKDWEDTVEHMEAAFTSAKAFNSVQFAGVEKVRRKSAYRTEKSESVVIQDKRQRDSHSYNKGQKTQISNRKRTARVVGRIDLGQRQNDVSTKREEN